MTNEPKKGSVGIKVGAGIDLTLKDVHIRGYEKPIQIDPGGIVETKKVSIKRGISKNSVGWSGREQFDPKRADVKLNDPFEGPKLLINEGANKHVAEFDHLAAGFFANKPYTPLAEIDSETGNLVHKLKATAQPPARLRYVSYAAVNDLRNALDQAVCASATLINGRPANDAYFPFGECPTDLQGALTHPTNALFRGAN